MKRTFRYIGALSLLTTLTGCIDFLGAGGCEHTYRDPLLTIAAVTSSASGEAVPRVVLSDFEVGGQAMSTQMVLLGESQRVILDAGAVVCDVACAFGTTEGRYEFIASAPGYQPTTVQVDARYPRFEGGCPSYNAGTNRVEIRLAPQ